MEREVAALVDAAFPDAAWIGEILGKGTTSARPRR